MDLQEGAFRELRIVCILLLVDLSDKICNKEMYQMVTFFDYFGFC
jgi:hypothetical protein